MMHNKRFNLEISEAAYHAVLEKVSQSNLVDPLPSLEYDNTMNTYAINAISISDIKRLGEKRAGEKQSFTYQVGRLIMHISNPTILTNTNGKKLNYVDKHFTVE